MILDSCSLTDDWFSLEENPYILKYLCFKLTFTFHGKKRSWDTMYFLAHSQCYVNMTLLIVASLSFGSLDSVPCSTSVIVLQKGKL